MSDHPHVTYKRHTFLSSLVTGASALGIVLVISCTVVVIYGMHFVGDRSDKFVSTVGSAIGSLDELQAALPPILADVLDDRRQPDYRNQIEITTRPAASPDHGSRIRTVIEVANNGDEVISYLSLRLVFLDADDDVVAESNEWAATPIATDGAWRGPLMPGSRRRFVSWGHRVFRASTSDELTTEVEITDLRVWNGAEEALAANTE